MIPRWRVAAVYASLALILLPGCGTFPWRDSEAGLPHFLQVNPHLYRGAQPTPEGFRRLAGMGVRTIIDLRAAGRAQREEERQLVESLGMRWIYLPSYSYWRPADAQIREFLAVVSDPSQQPVFVHCHRGLDRTGMMVAIYRIAEEGWSSKLAYEEALGLGLSPWNVFAQDLILHQAASKFRQPAAQ